MFNNTWYRKEKPTLSYPGYGGGVAGFAFMAAGGDYPGTGEWFGTRGLSGGGTQSGGNTNMIDYVTIASTGNAQDFGDLTTTDIYDDGSSDGSRGLFNKNNVIEYVTISSTGNASDFGDLSAARGAGSVSDGARACFAGGYISPGGSNIIDYVVIDTTGDATDFGDLTVGRWGLRGMGGATRGIWGGGEVNSGHTNTIDYVTIETTGNATDFGDMLQGVHGYAAYSVSSRGIFAGGYGPQNVIQYITPDSTGNATDFGDLTEVKYAVSGCCNSTRGIHWGGYNTSGGGGTNFNTIDYITIASTGDASDFGDMQNGTRSTSALSGNT